MPKRRAAYTCVAFCVDRGDWIETWFRYNAALVGAIKEIPVTRRKWDDYHGSWMVRNLERDELLAIFDRHNYDVEWLFADEPVITDEVQQDRDLTLLGLLTGASWDLIKSAHRIAAMANHPDRGGDEEKMKKINAAFERLERRYGSSR